MKTPIKLTQREQKQLSIALEETIKPIPMDMKNFSPEEQEEYNRILREESKDTGISIYDYYNLTNEDIHT